MKNLTLAILKVMESVKNIDKNLTVGDGRNSYKGVSDKDVKLVIGQEMQKNGLVIIPISIEPKVTIERWDEVYNGQAKVKQSVFTEVKTKYLLMHSSGESMEIQGYGHGVDSQDKSAGKATTYALKYALLYLFLTPTGLIDDADKKHSETIETPMAIDLGPFRAKLLSCKTLAELKMAFSADDFPRIELTQLKDELKTKLK